MKRSELTNFVQSVIKEMNTTGGGASFTPGSGAQTGSPKAFKKVKGKKRPHNTKMFDYLDEDTTGKI